MSGGRSRDGQLVVEGKGDPRQNHLCPILRRDVAEGVGAGVVGVVGRKHLVAAIEVQRAQDGVDGRGRIGDQGQVVRIDPDEGGELGSRPVEKVLQVSRQEARRMRLELGSSALVNVEDGAHTRPEGAVVEVRDRRIQRPFRSRRCRSPQLWRILVHLPLAPCSQIDGRAVASVVANAGRADTTAGGIG